MKEYTYRCNKKCPINKKCYIITTIEPLPSVVKVSYKCTFKKENIIIIIGGKDSP